MKTLFIRICLLFCLAVPVMSHAQGSPVPLIQLRTGHIAVTVRINGQGPYRLVFDTGSPVTFITRRAAKQAKLITGDSGGLGFMGMGGQEIAKTFAVGGAFVKDFSVMIMDHPVITMLSSVEGQLDGIVGMSFFSRFHTTIDYAGKTITLTPTKYQPKDVMQAIYTQLLNRGTDKNVLSPNGLWGFQAAKEGSEAGVVVKKVYAGSAAEAAGLKAGDRVLTIDSRWTDTPNDVFEAASRLPAGRDAVLEILRDGSKATLTLRPRIGL